MKKSSLIFWALVFGVSVALSAIEGGGTTMQNVLSGTLSFFGIISFAIARHNLHAIRSAWSCASSAYAEALRGVNTELHARNRYRF
ncbi:MAG: hypothetical protein HGB03_00220 [Candidatus Yonathbacteria bacterium]|nr:hypothetical protein [Candidatus Yonathbacteria bacterium]NTW48105.1 hypothetical protein [Candidatus Yonathbacteria bacterium]